CSLCKIGLTVVVFCGLAIAQSTSPQLNAPLQLFGGEPLQLASTPVHFAPQWVQLASLDPSPPPAPMPRITQIKALMKPQQMKALIKTQVNKAIDGKPYPSITEWHPLTPRQKFDVFLHSTYSPSTFLNAGIDVVADRVKGRNNPEYETGMMGW